MPKGHLFNGNYLFLSTLTIGLGILHTSDLLIVPPTPENERDYFSRRSLSRYLMDTIDFNKHDIDISKKISHGKNTQKTLGNSSILQGDLNFAFDQRESEVNLHKTTSSHESHSNMSPDIDDKGFMSIFIHVTFNYFHYMVHCFLKYFFTHVICRKQGRYRSVFTLDIILVSLQTCIKIQFLLKKKHRHLNRILNTEVKC